MAAAKATSCRDALARWEQSNSLKAVEAERVELWGQCPPIEKLDGSVAALRACRHLALSSNNIDKIGSLAGLESLEVLSLGRNCLKKLENLEAVAATLRELWVSYNQIDRLVRAQPTPVPPRPWRLHPPAHPPTMSFPGWH